MNDIKGTDLTDDGVVKGLMALTLALEKRDIVLRRIVLTKPVPKKESTLLGSVCGVEFFEER